MTRCDDCGSKIDRNGKCHCLVCEAAGQAKGAAMVRPVCPLCGAPVLPITTPSGEQVLLDTRPIRDVYTVHQWIDGSGMLMPSEVIRRLHICQSGEEGKS